MAEMLTVNEYAARSEKICGREYKPAYINTLIGRGQMPGVRKENGKWMIPSDSVPRTLSRRQKRMRTNKQRLETLNAIEAGPVFEEGVIDHATRYRDSRGILSPAKIARGGEPIEVLVETSRPLKQREAKAIGDGEWLLAPADGGRPDQRSAFAIVAKKL